jgi:ARID/BRIGHT DNA binding domain
LVSGKGGCCTPFAPRGTPLPPAGGGRPRAVPLGACAAADGAAHHREGAPCPRTLGGRAARVCSRVSQKQAAGWLSAAQQLQQQPAEEWRFQQRQQRHVLVAQVPKVGGRQLDLHVLYCSVTALGGCESVIARKQWRVRCLPHQQPLTALCWVSRLLNACRALECTWAQSGAVLSLLPLQT